MPVECSRVWCYLLAGEGVLIRGHRLREVALLVLGLRLQVSDVRGRRTTASTQQRRRAQQR